MPTNSRGPKVTVGVLVHNAQRTLRQTLQSVSQQTFTDFEVILSDDASTDASATICEEYVALDPRFRLSRHKENVGGIANFNSVVEMASGTYFVWLSDHDRWMPDYLASCVGELDGRPLAVLCHARAQVIDNHGRLLRPLESRLDTRGLSQQARLNVTLWSLENGTTCIYGMQRLDVLRQVPRYPRLYESVLAPDVVLLMEMALLGEFVFVDRLLFELREPEDVNDMFVYMAKLHLTPRSELDGLRLFGNILNAELRAVRCHVKGTQRRCAAIATIGLYMACSHRGLLKGAIAVGHRQRQGQQPITCVPPAVRGEQDVADR